MIGPRGPGLLKALHLGSTADWLLLHPPAPMLIARHGRAIRSIVVCTDGSPHASRTIRALAQLPWVEQTEITVLTVDDGRVAADIAIDEARSQFEPTGAVVQAVVEQGAPTPVIHEHLERHDPRKPARRTTSTATATRSNRFVRQPSRRGMNVLDRHANAFAICPTTTAANAAPDAAASSVPVGTGAPGR